MSCILTSGYTLDCRDNVGGIETIYITELENKNAITAASGIITAFTLKPTKQFWTYNIQKETANATENIPDGIANGTLHYEQTLVMTLRKLQATLRNEIYLLAQNNLMIIVKLRTGKFFLMGQNTGMELQTMAAATGTAMGDASGYTLTFMGKETSGMQEVSAGLLTTLTAPAA